MNALDSITLRAILTALQQMDGSLPLEVQDQLHSVGKALPENISRLHIIAKSYIPLSQKYRIARIALQTGFADHLRFTAPEVDNLIAEQDVEVIKIAAKVLNAPDSVYEVKELTKKSKLLNQILRQFQQYKEIPLREPSTRAKLAPESLPKMASTSKAMQAFLDTFEEWADVYCKLAES